MNRLRILLIIVLLLCGALPIFAQPIVSRPPLNSDNSFQANVLIVEPPTDPDGLSIYSDFLATLEATYNITIETRSLNPSGVAGKVIEKHFWQEDLGAETTAEICGLYNDAGYNAYLSYFLYLADLEVTGMDSHLYGDEQKPPFERDPYLENQLPYPMGNDDTSFPANDGGYLRAQETLWPPEEQPQEVVLLVISDTGLEWQYSDFIANLWQNPGEDLDGDGTIVDLGNGEYEFDPDDLDGMDSDGNGYNDLIGWNFRDQNEDVTSGDNQHGSAVYSVVGSQTYNGDGIAGLLFPGYVKIVPAQTGSGQGIDLDEAIEATYYAAYLVAQGYKVVLNMSWILGPLAPPEQPALEQALEIFSSFGGGAVAAAGNYGIDFLRPPASYENVIAVTASTINNVKAPFSSYGNWCDIAAPGEDIYAYVGADQRENAPAYDFVDGTSFSSPFVAAAAAIYWSIHPELNWEEVRERLLSAVYRPEDYPDDNENWPEPYYGAGILDTQLLFNQ